MVGEYQGNGLFSSGNGVPAACEQGPNNPE
jgi:hypothetical protein